MRRLRLAGLVLVFCGALLLPMVANSHPERLTTFPYPATGHVPVYRTTGPYNVVCTRGSRRALRREYAHNRRVLRARLKMLGRCRYHNIQAAIDHARSGYRIEIMPGVYTEQPSRRVPVGAPGQPPCATHYVSVEGLHSGPPPAGPASNDLPFRADRNYAIQCPNSKNLISVVGDPRPEPNPSAPTLPLCLRLCNLQIEGMGASPRNVDIIVDRKKSDGLRIDRANGIYLRNFTIEQAAFNNIDIVEVDGFRVSNVITRWAQNYGVLSFTTIHGLYDSDTAYGNGDSGLYPGSTMKGCGINPNTYGTCAAPRTCGPPSVEIRNSVSYGNTLGYSGTAGNNTYVHDNKFFDNASGLATDSFAAGHPGMPQECFDWERNQIYSNNNNVFSVERQNYCRSTPFVNRTKTIVCPQFQTPVGTGVVIGGGNRDLLKNNWIYDNWRQGVILLSVPATIRGDNDPAHQQDTSNGNQFIGNFMGRAPDGSRHPNGLEFEWDSGGAGNCWQNNTMVSGHGSDPAILPSCPGLPVYLPPNPAVTGAQVPCTAWDPKTNPEPVGCNWFTTPAKPQ